MDIRPFRPCTSADISAVQASTGEAAERWACEWLGRGVATGTVCRPLDGASLHEVDEQAHWFRCDGALGSVWASSRQREAMASLLFAAGPTKDGIARVIAGEVLDALLRALARSGEAAEVQAASPPAHLRDPGRRAMALSLRLADEELWMLMELPHADLELGVSRRDGVLPAQGAIAKQTVRVDVRLGESELDLGSLQTLSVGDVLRLDKKLDEGVELHVGDQRLPCIGYLAAHDGDVVIELARR